jgi:hypothetical protein
MPLEEHALQLEVVWETRDVTNQMGRRLVPRRADASSRLDTSPNPPHLLPDYRTSVAGSQEGGDVGAGREARSASNERGRCRT